MGYYLQRVGQAVFTLVAVMSMAFAMYRFLPGGPIDYLRAQFARSQGTGEAQSGAGQQSGGSTDMSQDQFAQLAEAYTGVNPDKPIWQAYLDYMSGVFLQGDFGRSIYYSEPVSDIIAGALPWTLFILTGVTVATFLISIFIGSLMAYYEGSKFDAGMTIYNLVAHSVPFFIVAVILIAVFAVQMEWLPIGGRYAQKEVTPGMNVDFFASVLRHAALPWASLLLVSFGASLTMRGNSIRVLGSDYMRVARLRGLPTSRLTFRYVLRNAVLPMYTGFLISLSTLFSGSVILERIFNYFGLGYYTVQAFVSRDYPLLMATFILTTAVVVVGVLIADVTYGFLDPRVESGDTREAF